MAKKQNREQKTAENHVPLNAGIESQTGVSREEIEAVADTTPLVRTEPSTSFSERTSHVQPWAEYQEAVDKAESEAAKEAREDNEQAARDSKED